MQSTAGAKKPAILPERDGIAKAMP